MKTEKFEKERLQLLGVDPVSARRGSGDTLIRMSRGRAGLMGVLTISGSGVHKAEGADPDVGSVRAIVELAARWFGGMETTQLITVACEEARDSGWKAALFDCQAMKLIGGWGSPRWPGCKPGSDAALRGLFGERAAVLVEASSEARRQAGAAAD